ncbi:double-strand break repair protein AddB [Ketogulonicigenium vulgare]|uniref:RecB family exonuclease-like protein n=1 Tax=Ketogulonicigenium vulgare (strain WSH-001) TaxID=759362 RepID=F9Y6A4_KETVW|nr:double-strand break repair protein AddB [Ketogulonicigenium vulgare]ADO43842.1 exonuclease-like protein [Ketogulonicigenium vulgare Y25]AEM42101.1 RecB family exonuclease-like protein [Ketogulonicigenium vulgare WSH-001]ALJ79730.1 double-strand break repair protein AddB [Ketogulonicigenium vulgare]ANW32654.1 double-strand break repair protein AddB [Ketogulonicigenium vulgare]AOZ55877.1 putative Helicase/Exonuclease [Ketogulonicigenium vulgare]
MIFDESARLFGLPPGADFPAALIAGLHDRMAGRAPEDWARVTLYVNTARMQRRLRNLFDQGGAMILPRIRLVTDLALDPVAADLPLPVPALQRRLELTRLIARLLESAPDLAPRAALYDLADSLAALMDEMQGEGVSPDVIAALDVSDQSGHWQRTLEFLKIISGYFDQTGQPDREARQRMVIERLVAHWQIAPPTDPIIIAGSTGSRGATQLLMQAVARLPQGAVVLPGFDFDMPDHAWEAIGSAVAAEDHPQFRFRKIADGLGLALHDIRPWTSSNAPDPARNRLISLSLRPAPVTDQWRLEGKDLGDLNLATAQMTLLEAPSPRLEAQTIALRLRAALDEGRTAALITPDRMLTRQVAAALDLWSVKPDDSAGQPLPLSPPGRLLRQVARLFGQRLDAESLLSLLKHPLTHADANRGQHLLNSHDLERYIRDRGMPFPTATALLKWAGQENAPDHRRAWAEWVIHFTNDLDRISTRPLSAHLAHLIDTAEEISRGPALWEEAAGRKARAVIADLQLNAPHGGEMEPRDFTAILDGVLRGAEVRNPDTGHPNLLIWGTLEARVQGADLVILAGLNEGIWPGASAADPWLNRALRARAGLLLPERRIGLAAHDYQQAIAAPEVWLSRAIRSSDAETVAARWVNRLTNLLEGLPDQNGPAALAAMRAKGDAWLARASAMSQPDTRLPAAARPAPRPPLAARPTKLSVTGIETLLRDPYAIYARHVLRLNALGPLNQSADARMRGTVIHKVYEDFINSGTAPDAAHALALLDQFAIAALDEDCPWPVTARQWLSQIRRAAPYFLQTEGERQAKGTPTLLEKRGEIALGRHDFTLVGKADRIDLQPDGQALIYDYKTGAPPSAKSQRYFDKQLLIEAAMIARGAFQQIGPRDVAGAEFIGLGSKLATVPAPLDELPPAQIWAELQQLIDAWMQYPRGYTARIAPFEMKYASDYDHLARYGEWGDSDLPQPEDLA